MALGSMEMFPLGDKKLTTCLVLLLLDMFLDGAETATTQADIDRHLEMGRDLLARGQLADALTHYHAAVGKYHWWLMHINAR